VKLAVLQLHKEPFDMVVSGINNGANAGINAYYSGTVAAAMEAAFLRIPSVALSVAAEENVDFETAADYCEQILKKLVPLQSGYVVNVNLPQLSLGAPKGIRVVPQSTEGFHEYYESRGCDQGLPAFQLAGGLHRDEDSYVDTKSLAEGYITITALAPGMTDFENTRRLADINWQ
jgi:5'-nucleotidase